MRDLGSLRSRGLRFLPCWFIGGLLGYFIESGLIGGRGETGIMVGILAGTLVGFLWRPGG